MDFTKVAVGIFFGTVHLAASYYAVAIAKLTHIQYLALVLVVALIDAQIVKYFNPGWKKHFSAIYTDFEKAQFENLLFTIAILGFGFASHAIVRKQYGLGVLMGAIAIHIFVGAAV